MNSLFLTIGYVLVDVTNTGEVSSSTSVARNQQRNWETLVQVLGLRTQLMHLSQPEVSEVDLTDLKFGSAYTGIHKVWKFKFGIEHEAVYANETSLYGTLEQDFVNVPIIVGLGETADIVIPTFIVSGTTRNIYFEPFNI